MGNVIVAGGATGIGRAAVRGFRERGDNVLLVDHRPQVLDLGKEEAPGKIRIIQRELALQRPIREALLALQERNHLGTEGREVHQRPSTCVSAASVWGSQNVMAIDVYLSMAVDNAVRACSRWPVVA